MISGTALSRRHPEKVQRIVHPAHIPLVVKAQSVIMHRSRHLQEVGGILGDQHHIGKPLLDLVIQLLEKLDAPDVDAPGHIPLPVQHVADGIHPQSVHMIVL